MKFLLIISIFSILIYSCSEDSCDCPSLYGNYSNFRITQQTFPESIDLDSVINVKYGSNYRMADWNDLLKIISIEEFTHQVGIQNNSYFFVKNNGARFFDNSPRHYFISRFDHIIPDNYLVHDQIDDNFLCLGSWFNDTLQILIVKR